MTSTRPVYSSVHNNTSRVKAKQDKTYSVWIPETFRPSRILPYGLRLREDDAKWFTGTILSKAAHGQVDEFGYARLHSAVLRRVMSQRTCDAVIDALVDGGVVDNPAPHYAGVKSRGYRISEEYLSDSALRVDLHDTHLVARIHRELAAMREKQQRRELPIHRRLAEVQRMLSVTDEADAIVASLEKREARACQDALVSNIRSRSPSFTLGSTGRVFNGLTGTKKILRPAIRLDGEPIGGVDISSTQPALLACLMGSEANFILSRLTQGAQSVATYIVSCSRCSSLFAARNAGDCDDVGLFRDKVSSGSLYPFLLEECLARGVPCDGKDGPLARAKRLVLQDVLAKRGGYRSGFEDLFREHFPTVHHFIRCVNRYCHATLIRALQRIESWLVIENVAPRLVDRIPIVTLHDAIYSRLDDVPVVEDAFNETFDNLGLSLAVKREIPQAVPDVYATCV